MTINEIEAKLAEDRFSFELRMNLNYDEAAFVTLINLLKQLSTQLKNIEIIAKSLAQDLYVITNVIRNTLDYLKINQANSELTQKVEGAWIDIDNLIIECLVSR